MLSRNALSHKWLLRVKPHSFPTVSQLEFSPHFLEGVHATFAVLPPPRFVDFAKQRKQRTRPILLSPFRTKERRRDVLHALFLEKLGKNGEKKYRAMFVY